MDIWVNGQSMTLPESCDIAALIGRLGLSLDGVAVALNGEVVPRSERTTRELAEGDRVEIVHAVGGG